MAEPWTLERIGKLISGRVQEDLHLDYKAAGSLDRSEKKKDEISKDVSAFANADGGIIIYGVSEDSSDSSIPGAIDPVDSMTHTAEWLEQILTSRIQPKIPGLVLTTLEVSAGRAIYVVEVPKGETAHQASDRRYHKRLGRITEMMWDYEVRDVMNRRSTPKVSIRATIEKRTKERGLVPSIMDDIPSPSRDLKLALKPLARPKYLLRIHAVNEGALVVQYITVFITVDPPLQDEQGRPLKEVICTNTVRDTLRWSYIPAKGPDSAYPEYGPSRYEPVLPGLTFMLEDFEINPDSIIEETMLTWKVFADNARPMEGSVMLKSLKIREEDD